MKVSVQEQFPFLKRKRKRKSFIGKEKKQLIFFLCFLYFS